jgi:hypothetical protein
VIEGYRHFCLFLFNYLFLLFLFIIFGQRVELCKLSSFVAYGGDVIAVWMRVQIRCVCSVGHIVGFCTLLSSTPSSSQMRKFFHGDEEAQDFGETV